MPLETNKLVKPDNPSKSTISRRNLRKFTLKILNLTLPQIVGYSATQFISGTKLLIPFNYTSISTQTQIQLLPKNSKLKLHPPKMRPEIASSQHSA